MNNNEQMDEGLAEKHKDDELYRTGLLLMCSDTSTLRNIQNLHDCSVASLMSHHHSRKTRSRPTMSNSERKNCAQNLCKIIDIIFISSMSQRHQCLRCKPVLSIQRGFSVMQITRDDKYAIQSQLQDRQSGVGYSLPVVNRRT